MLKWVLITVYWKKPTIRSNSINKQSFICQTLYTINRKMYLCSVYLGPKCSRDSCQTDCDIFHVINNQTVPGTSHSGCVALWMAFIPHHSSRNVFLTGVKAAVAAAAIGSSVPAVCLHELLCAPVLLLRQVTLWYNVSVGRCPSQWLQRQESRV